MGNKLQKILPVSLLNIPAPPRCCSMFGMLEMYKTGASCLCAPPAPVIFGTGLQIYRSHFSTQEHVNTTNFSSLLGIFRVRSNSKPWTYTLALFRPPNKSKSRLNNLHSHPWVNMHFLWGWVAFVSYFDYLLVWGQRDLGMEEILVSEAFWLPNFAEKERTLNKTRVFCCLKMLKIPTDSKYFQNVQFGLFSPGQRKC